MPDDDRSAVDSSAPHHCVMAGRKRVLLRELQAVYNGIADFQNRYGVATSEYYMSGAAMPIRWMLLKYPAGMLPILYILTDQPAVCVPLGELFLLFATMELCWRRRAQRVSLYNHSLTASSSRLHRTRQQEHIVGHRCAADEKNRSIRRRCQCTLRLPLRRRHRFSELRDDQR